MTRALTELRPGHPAPPERSTHIMALPENHAEDWRDDALCVETDPALFFPETGGSTKEARSICRRCAVRDDCLTYAITHDQKFGVWGGLSERERRPLRARRAERAAEARRPFAAGWTKPQIRKALGTNSTIVNSLLSEGAA